jgi:hypothetical protein
MRVLLSGAITPLTSPPFQAKGALGFFDHPAHAHSGPSAPDAMTIWIAGFAGPVLAGDRPWIQAAGNCRCVAEQGSRSLRSDWSDGYREAPCGLLIDRSACFPPPA